MTPAPSCWRRSGQSYTVRQLNSKRSSLPESENDKLVHVKEDALSKYLDVVCFPTGKCGESHPRRQHITSSEFRLMNKDGCFRKELLWQKEMLKLASGVYNMVKGTQQHAMPVKEWVSRNEEEVEANLSTEHAWLQPVLVPASQ